MAVRGLSPGVRVAPVAVTPDYGNVEAKRLRELDLDALAAEAIGMYTGSPARRAEIELERRLIAQSIHASRRLEIATWAIAVLTGALILIAVLEIVVGLLD